MKRFLALAFLSVVGCGGAANTTGSATGGNASIAGSSSGGATSSSGGESSRFGGNTSGGNNGSRATCPSQPPSQSSPCEGEVSCSYGDSPEFRCRLFMSCMSGHWEISQGACTWQQPSACPASEPALGAVCEPPNDAPNLDCRYGEHSQRDCVCHTCTRFDYCEAGDEPGWTCKDPPTRLGCPEVTPNLGAPCAGPGRECSYGHRCIDGIVLRCTDAGWTLVATACPE